MTGNHIWDHAWKMVVDRSATAEAMFVYAVRTTGVYCRPSCPSRRPLRKSVEFYPTSELAERAGYRACKRCTPAQEHPQLRTLTAACNYLDRHDNGTVKLQELGKAVGLSPFHVQRIFRRCLGITPREYQQARRIERFRQQVAQGDTVTTALYEAGFGSSSRLYEGANGQLGMTPAELRGGGKDIQIRYSISDSPLDKMLVAVTGVGLCAISFGLLESELEDDLAARFPWRNSIATSKALGPWCERSCRSCQNIRQLWTCRWMCEPLPSRNACGRRCSRFREARHDRIAKSQSLWASQPQCARWRVPAARILSQW